MQHVRMAATALLVFGVAVAVWGGTASAVTADPGERAGATTDVNLTVTVAPGETLSTLRSADSPADVGNVTTTERHGTTFVDVVVLKLRGPGLATAVSRQPGTNDTARLFSLLDDENSSLRGVEITQEDARPPRVLDLTDPSAVSTVAVDNETLWLVVDPASLSATRDENRNGLADDADSIAIDTGESYRLTFAFEGEVATASLGFFPTVVNVAVDPSRTGPIFYPAAAQPLRARSTLAPGSVVTVELTATGDESFQRTRRVRLREGVDSRLETSFDLRGAPAGSPVSVAIRYDGDLIDETEGEIPVLSASLDAPSHVATGEPLQVRRARLSEGGFLVVRDGGPSGPVVGTRALDRGEVERLSIEYDRPPATDTLWVATYLDADRDGTFDPGGPDRPYRDDGSAVSATVRVGTPTVTAADGTTAASGPNASSTVRDANGSTTTAAANATAPPTATTEAGSPGRAATNGTTARFTSYTLTAAGGPGFGVEALVVALVLVASVLAVRG